MNQDIGRSLLGVLALMAVLSLLETAIPFFRTEWRRRHLWTNLALVGLALGQNLLLNGGVMLATAWLGSSGPGFVGSMGLSPLATTLVTIVVLDASTYVCHRSMHAIPALWSAHSVHHSDPLVDVTTSLRFHPLETLWRFAFVVGPAWVLGLPLEAVAAYRLVSAVFSLFEHVNVKLWQPLDTALSLVLGTPNMHKVHHSRDPRETDTNYGNILSLFDRALRTFTPSRRASEVRYGLDGRDSPEAQKVGELLRSVGSRSRTMSAGATW